VAVGVGALPHSLPGFVDLKAGQFEMPDHPLCQLLARPSAAPLMRVTKRAVPICQAPPPSVDPRPDRNGPRIGSSLAHCSFWQLGSTNFADLGIPGNLLGHWPCWHMGGGREAAPFIWVNRNCLLLAVP
jgi:hypothetical protein